MAKPIAEGAIGEPENQLGIAAAALMTEKSGPNILLFFLLKAVY